ncbi:MAG: YggT family protein [Pseudomonadota bacterium]
MAYLGTGLAYFFDILILLLMVRIAVMWLTRFSVMNEKNPTVILIQEKMSGLMSPITKPIKALIPDIGGVDISFAVMIVLLISARLLISTYFGT